MAESTAQLPKTEPSDTPDNTSAEENLVPTQDQAMDSIEDPLRSSEEDGKEDDETAPSNHPSRTMVNGHHHEMEGMNGHVRGDEDEEGLFGSASEAEDAGPLRKLDDEELDSGDDEDRNDRLMDDADGDMDMGIEGHSANIMDVKLGRHAVPDPSDGELYLLKFPNFLGLEPKIYRHEDFQPPVTDHHSTGPPSSTFSPYSTAISTIRWRRSPRNPSRLQSNARILRWSDGSLTMQLASNATEQLELPAKPLAPPQRNPLKPTPTALNRSRAVTNGDAHAPYNPQLESHTYLTTPHESASFLRVTNHITTSLTVLPSSDQNDDALIRLQESLAAAVRGNKTSADGGVGLIAISEDPELAKKKAEVAEREKLRAQRRRQQQEERERDRANRVLGKSGLRSSGGVGGGLTVGGLEDDDGMATTKARGPSRPKRKPRRNSEYSDDEDGFRNRGRTREDEYDEDDGFLVGSDEEPEVVEGSEDEDEGLGDADGEGVSEEEKPKRKKSPKREREREREGRVEKMEGVEDGGVAARGKRRKVVEDEEDE